VAAKETSKVSETVKYVGVAAPLILPRGNAGFDLNESGESVKTVNV